MSFGFRTRFMAICLSAVSSPSNPASFASSSRDRGLPLLRRRRPVDEEDLCRRQQPDLRLLRSLIDKVILQRVVRDRITIRIVWRGGEVTEREVEPRVHSLSALSRGADMEARLIEMAHQGLDDTEIAAKLTEEGFRSPRCSYVPVRTVQVVRQRRRVLRQPAAPARSYHLPGWLTVSELAIVAGVSRSWIRHRIRNGMINVRQNERHKRVLFPDATATIAAIQELKAGMRQHLDFTQSAPE